MGVYCQKTTLVKARFSGINYIWLLLLAVSSSLAHATGEYLLGDGDTVNITVYGHQDLTLVAKISPAGTISYPLLDEITIGGLSPQAAGREIARMLKEGGFIKSPQVSLSVQDYSSQQIHIIGQIGSPGNYPLEGESNVVDMITVVTIAYRRLHVSQASQ